jgi:hypothetical protein
VTDAALQPAEDAPRACPSCHAVMRRQGFASRAVTGHGGVDLDICYDCQGIWFDPFESAQLSPAAILQLFEAIRKQTAPARPLATNCTCPVCHHSLALTHDFERTNRLTYYRCPAGHGRFTTFMQFLREKNFVRTLSPAEVYKLRAVVAQVKCSSCGAPIDLAKDSECSYCHAPIAVLDADAVGKTVAELQARAAAPPPKIDVAEAMGALMQAKHTERELDEPPDLVRFALSLVVDSITIF